MKRLTYSYQDAQLSFCRRYRYTLTRVWAPLAGGAASYVCWVMLNPSTADAEQDDATIRRCAGFTVRWGFDAMIVVNLFAYRARSPAAMKATDDPIGPDNDRWISSAATTAKKVVCAWGVHGAFRDRGYDVRKLLQSVGCEPLALARCANGEPAHPLFLDYSRPLQPLEWL